MNKWKSAVITPAYKGGNKEMVINYRPISVLPFMDKILERIIKESLMDHLESQNCIKENQGGYRKNYSTITMTSTAPNHPLFERQDRCSFFSVLCYFRYFVRE